MPSGDNIQVTPRLAPATPEAAMIRERVLDVCRRLFNEQGFPNVTTARIAAALGMNEGRLHYYFNTKAQIVTPLFEAFESSISAAAAHGLDAPGRLDRYADYQRNWFVVMWRYRFFYRDQRALHRIAPRLKRRSAKLSELNRLQLRRVLEDMAGLGLIHASSAELERLSLNCWIVSSYWIDYVATLREDDRITPEDLEGGIRQIDSLFSPYLTKYGQVQHARRRKFAEISAEQLDP